MILQGDCLIKLKELPDNSVDSVVTDPPYELGFMGKAWDSTGIAYNPQVWRECLRVLKPGGHLLSFGGSRTYHRMAVAIEDAGFEIRDQIMWVYGSGFPKSLNIGKAVDKMGKVSTCCNADVDKALRRIGTEEYLCRKCGKHCGIKRPEIEDRWEKPQNKSVDYGEGKNNAKCKICGKYRFAPDYCKCKEPELITEQAKQWEGWGTALKPAHEPIVLARKPLSEKNVAENVLKWGTGGINIDGSRVGTGGDKGEWPDTDRVKTINAYEGGYKNHSKTNQNTGRFPANLIHDGSDEVIGGFPNTKTGAVKDTIDNGANQPINLGGGLTKERPTDSGSAARFFYTAKASKSERNKGLEGFEEKDQGTKSSNERNFSDDFKEFGDGESSGHKNLQPQKNFHPTVKPLSLMRYLCKLITPPKGVVLDPFMGSGSTGIAAKLEGFDFIGIEMEPDYIKIAEARIKAWKAEPEQISI